MSFVKIGSKINIDSFEISTVEVEESADYGDFLNLYPSLKIVNIKLENMNYINEER